MKNVVMIRKTKEIIEEVSPKGATFLYKNIFGRMVLSLATKRFVSSIAGHYMNKKISTRHIDNFIKDNKLDMSDYPKREYKSFNDFFAREIDLNKRPCSGSKRDFVSPADSKLLVYKIDKDKKFKVKEKYYTLKEILRDDNLANKYQNGYFLVFRLSVDCYHRYHFIDDGKVIKEKKINGKFHTVGPIVFDHAKVFSENQREYSVLKTSNFGEIIQMEVGALMVGKIINHKVNAFKKGDEKGYFLFGGSTVVIIVKENEIEIDEDIIENSNKGIETRVNVRETIGKKVRRSND